MCTLSTPFKRTIVKFLMSTFAPEMLFRSGAVGVVRVARVAPHRRVPLLPYSDTGIPWRRWQRCRHLFGGAMKSARVFRPAFAKANKVDARREHDAARNKVRASRRWYGLKAWQVRRAEQLAREPLCSFCLRHGLTVAAMVADHVEPHNDDWEMFISGELQSLCKPCHDSDKQRAERFAERMKSNRRS